MRRPARGVLVADDPLRNAASRPRRCDAARFHRRVLRRELCARSSAGRTYRDQDHLAVTFADTLAPSYTAAIIDELRAPRP